jgi:hypothetical protein
LFLPSEPDSIRGEHVVVLLNGPDVDYSRYVELARLADAAYEEVVGDTGLAFTATILLGWSDTIDEGVAAAGSYWVHAEGSLLATGQSVAAGLVLRHEFAHVLAMAYFGLQETICLSEGFAHYIAYKKAWQKSSARRSRIAELLPITYQDSLFLGAIPGFDEEEAYDLAADFVTFWCERYGLFAFYDLYRTTNAVNYRTTIARYSGETFDGVVEAFRKW